MTGIGIPGFQSFLDWGFYLWSEIKPFPVHACEPWCYSSECVYKEQWGRRARHHLPAVAKDCSEIFISLFLPLMQSHNFIQQVHIEYLLYSQSCARDLGRHQRRSTYGTFSPSHQVSNAIQPSHPVPSPSPPVANPSQNQSLFQWINLCMSWPKNWSFSNHWGI